MYIKLNHLNSIKYMLYLFYFYKLEFSKINLKHQFNYLKN
jgi:hypothetical protein